MNRSRRTFLVTGALGTAALATAGWLQVRSAQPSSGHGLGPGGAAIMGALVPALLAGALPGAPGERRDAIAETVAAIDGAIAGLPSNAQAELAELFGLLSFAPARIAVAGLRQAWSDAPVGAVEDVLQRWRSSRFTLLRSAYGALHQLVLAAWYGNPRAWTAIGYPGPPVLS